MFDFLRMRFDGARLKTRPTGTAGDALLAPLAEADVFKRRGLGPLGARGVG